MIKKVYNIVGFDCANCAAKTEAHLNRDERINSAHIDFAINKLYVTFENNELSIKELLKLIAEVETDEITLTSANEKVAKRKIFTKDLLILSLRVLFGIIVIILNYTAFKEENNTNFWINFSLYLVAIIILTYDIVWRIILHIIHKENPIDEYLLITIAVVGSFLIATVEHSNDFMESVMVVALFQIGRVIEGIATNKSKEAVMSAMDLRVESASLLINGEIKNVKPDDLKINDIVVVAAGEIIPIDGIVTEGEGYVDTSSLTGEFMPMEIKCGSEVFSGCIIKSGSFKIQTTKEYSESTVSKILELITNSGEKKSRADKFITKFARWYTPLIFIASFLFAIIGGAISQDWPTYILNGLKMLVVACPCAIVISVPLAYFSGVGLASKNGIVIKGTSYLDELTRMKKLITDKTGTLTHGSFTITKIQPEKISEEKLIQYLRIAECLSKHPIGKAICHGKNMKKVAAELKYFNEIVGLGVQTTYKKSCYLAGSKKLMNKFNIDVPEPIEYGSIIYCAVDNKYMGYVVLSDEVKEDAEPMVSLLHSEKVEIILLTGDKESNTNAICAKLGIDRYHSELLPEDKTHYLEDELSKDNSYSVAYIGDGINDAACIKMSDIGIAMGGIGSDIAVDNADVVIMNDDPAKVWDALRIAKMARNTSIFNIVCALTIKIGLEIITIVSTLTKLFVVPMWVAVIADTGLTVLLVLNSLYLLYRKVKRKKL